MTVAPQLDMELLTALVNNPDWIEQELAERSLAEFIRQMWTSIDPSPYVANWHIDAIAEHLEAVNRGEISRLIINIPPRHMKSIAVSVAWPAWTWTQQATTPLRGPTVRFLYASYAQSLSIRDSVKCRRVIDSPLYQQRWGDQFKWVGDQNTKIRFDNDQKGYRIATSVDGALTGEGGDVIVIDDPHNVTEAESETVRQSALDWWDESMSNRLNDAQTGAYVVIMQRVHDQDFTGHLLDKGRLGTSLPTHALRTGSSARFGSRYANGRRRVLVASAVPRGSRRATGNRYGIVWFRWAKSAAPVAAHWIHVRQTLVGRRRCDSGRRSNSALMGFGRNRGRRRLDVRPPRDAFGRHILRVGRTA